MTDRYIWHITLQTGDARRSWRHEIDPELMPQIAAILDAALAADAIEPTRAQMDAHPLGLPRLGAPLCVPGYGLIATAEGRCLIATVLAHGTDGPLPLVTFGVAAHARCGAGLWRLLTEVPQRLNPAPERPQAPWCAAKLMPALSMHLDAARWLGDLERCIAWAWVDRW